VTLTFEVTVHVRDVGHRAPIHIPSLKLVGLLILKIGLIFGHGVTQPGDLDLCPLNGVMSHPCHELPYCQFSASIPDLRSGTDGQTDNSHKCIMPPPYEGRVIISDSSVNSLMKSCSNCSLSLV